ncbi:MAG: RibD family protein [Oligoflexales bacterium]
MTAGINQQLNAEFKKIRSNWSIAEKQHKRARPFVTVCVAQSLDGCITFKRNKRTQLSGAKSNILTHIVRSWNDAILVGANTVHIDNPRLTVRAVKAPQPQRVLLDSKLSIPMGAHLLTDSHAKPWIFAGKKIDLDKKTYLERKGCKVFSTGVQDGYLNLHDCLDKLYAIGIRHIMVEGGNKVLTSFLHQKLVDYMVITIAPVILRRHDSVLMHDIDSKLVPYLKSVQSCALDNDLVVFGPIDFAEVDASCDGSLSNYSWEGISGRENECLV